MKKLIFTCFCSTLLICTGAFAATQQYDRNVSKFSAIDISGPFSVSLVRGSESRVLLSVEEDYIDYVICNVKSSVLSIGLDERKVPSEVKKKFRGRGTPDPVFSAVIYVPDLIQTLTMSGKAVLREAAEVFDKSGVSFTLEGNCELKHLSVDTQNFSLAMQNKAAADISVSCRESHVETGNAASLKYEEESENSSFSLSGNCKLSVSSKTKLMNIASKGNCSMKLSGSGDKAVYNISGTSEVDASGFEVPDAEVTMQSVCKLTQAAYKSLTVNLSGGSSLYFAGEPSVTIENIKSATMSRTGSRNAGRI